MFKNQNPQPRKISEKDNICKAVIEQNQVPYEDGYPVGMSHVPSNWTFKTWWNRSKCSIESYQKVEFDFEVKFDDNTMGKKNVESIKGNTTLFKQCTQKI